MRSLILALAALLSAAASAAPLTVTTPVPAARAAFERGRDQFENHHSKEAEVELRKAIALDPEFPSALSYLGVQLRGDEGLALARKAMTFAGKLPEPERLLLKSHLEQLEGKEEAARATLREAAKLSPDDWRLQYYAGRRALLDRLSGLAVLYLRKAAQLNPNAPPVWNVMGYLLANQGDFDGAIEAMKKYEKLLPNDPNPPDSLAEIYLRAGKLDEADKAYGRSAVLSPNATNAYLGQAQVRFLRGDTAAGLQSAAKAREMAPVFDEKQQAERMIAWGYLAAGKGAEALKQIHEVAGRAHKQGAFFEEMLATANEARIRIETGDAKGALDLAREAVSTSSGRAMVGNQAVVVKQRAQTAVLLAALKLGQLADAEKAAAELDKLHKEVPENNALLLAMHFAAGMVALGKGDGRAAAAELSRCSALDAYCAWKLIDAQTAAGDAQAAAATRSALLKRNDVEQVYLDEDPLLIYVHSRLAQR